MSLTLELDNNNRENFKERIFDVFTKAIQWKFQLELDNAPEEHKDYLRARNDYFANHCGEQNPWGLHHTIREYNCKFNRAIVLNDEYFQRCQDLSENIKIDFSALNGSHFDFIYHESDKVVKDRVIKSLYIYDFDFKSKNFSEIE